MVRDRSGVRTGTRVGAARGLVLGLGSGLGWAWGLVLGLGLDWVRAGVGAWIETGAGVEVAAVPVPVSVCWGCG